MDELLAQFTPEELAELIGLGTLDERGATIDQQLLQAQALQRPQTGPHSTGAGAALGGLGDAVRSWAGAFREHGLPGSGPDGGLRGQQAALLKKKDDGRMLFLKALRERQQVPGSAGMGDLPGLFGVG